MESLTIVILAATSAIFGAATLLLGKEIRNIRGQLWSQEAQRHIEGAALEPGGTEAHRGAGGSEGFKSSS